jgi:hypothetical protein
MSFEIAPRCSQGPLYVSQALPMRNSTGVTLYHLIFATHYEVAVRIANGILKSESARKIDGK